MRMEWIIFALIGHFILTFALIFGKIIRTKIIQSSIIYLVYVGFISSIVFVLIPFVNFTIVNKTFLIYAFLTSIPLTIGGYLLIKSFSLEEVSRISIIRQFQPVFVLVIAILFLGEILSAKQYFGFFILLTGSIVASYKGGYSIMTLPSKAFFIVMGTNFFWAIYFTMAKYAYTVYGFWNTFIMVRIFFLFYSILILFYLIYKKRFNFSKILTKGTAFVGFNEFMVVIAVGFIQYALSLGPASLVSITESTKPIFVLFLAYFFSIKFPKLLKEEISKKIISQKIMAIFLIIVGLILINL